VAFDDAVVVGEEEEGFGIGVLRRADGGADGADVVAKMRDAGGGYACEDAFLAHCVILLLCRAVYLFSDGLPIYFGRLKNASAARLFGKAGIVADSAACPRGICRWFPAAIGI